MAAQRQSAANTEQQRRERSLHETTHAEQMRAERAAFAHEKQSAIAAENTTATDASTEVPVAANTADTGTQTPLANDAAKKNALKRNTSQTEGSNDNAASAADWIPPMLAYQLGHFSAQADRTSAVQAGALSEPAQLATAPLATAQAWAATGASAGEGGLAANLAQAAAAAFSADHKFAAGGDLTYDLAAAIQTGTDAIGNVTDGQMAQCNDAAAWLTQLQTARGRDAAELDQSSSRAWADSQNGVIALDGQWSANAASNIGAVNASGVNLGYTPVLAAPADNAAVMTSQISVPFSAQERWQDAMHQQVLTMAGNGDEVASLTLSPPDLGPIQVVLKVDNQSVDTSFVTDNPLVRQALEDGLQQLRERMHSQGMQLGATFIGTGQQAQQHFQQQTAHAQSPQSEQHSTLGSADASTESTSKPSLRRIALGQVDTFA